MDSLLSQLLSFPPHPPPMKPLKYAEYDKQSRAMVTLLQKATATKLKQKVSGNELLDVLDPSINTLPYLFTLLVHVGPQNAISPGTPLWQQTLLFIEKFDPVQVRYAGGEWRRLIDSVKRGADNAGMSKEAIGPIKAAMLRLDPSTSTMTSTHVQFLHLCLAQKKYEEALPILNNNIYHLPANPKKVHVPLPCGRHLSSSTYITTTSRLSSYLVYQDTLKYFLYGGMIYLKLKEWKKGIEFLEMAMVAPVHSAPSMIQVEAYKTWCLATLLLYGQPKMVPKALPQHVLRHVRNIAKPYEALGEAFKDPNRGTLKGEIDAGQNIWAEDCNTGLVCQVYHAHQRFAISALGKAFVSISLKKIPESAPSLNLSIQELYDLTRKLIASEQLDAILIPKGPELGETVLRFVPALKDQATLFKSIQLQRDTAELNEQHSRIKALTAHVQDIQHKIEMSPEFVETTKKQRAKDKSDKNGAGPSSAGGTQDSGFLGGDDMLDDM